MSDEQFPRFGRWYLAGHRQDRWCSVGLCIVWFGAWKSEWYWGVVSPLGKYLAEGARATEKGAKESATRAAKRLWAKQQR